MQRSYTLRPRVDDVVYVDEEVCLGADVFANELELLVGNAKLQGRHDQSRLLELLPKLAATIPNMADRSSLKSVQKKCEPAFNELIAAGVCATVRRLICVCLTRFYMHGDMISIYSRVSGMQSTLAGKDPGQSIKPMTDVVRAGMLEVLAYLSLHHGRYLASAAAESMAIANKSVAKGATQAIRLAGMHLAAAAVEGLNPLDRTAPLVQGEAWALFQRACRDRTCAESLAAGANVLSGLARGGGHALWRDGTYYWEESLRLCTSNLDHPSQAVRDAFAMALCDLAVAPRLDTIRDVIKDEKRASKKAALERLAADSASAAFTAALVQPLVAAALRASNEVCTSLSLAWVSYINWVAAHSAGDTSALVHVAVQVVQLCDNSARALAEAKAQGSYADANLGGALAGGEIPLVQACALYILRTGIVELLTETSQRLLLQRFINLLLRPGCAVPSAVVALEGMSILLDVLGEVGEETGGTAVVDVLMLQVTSSSGPVRQQACQAVAALAAAQPSSAARLLSQLLDMQEAAAQLLGGVRSSQASSPTHAYNTLMGKQSASLMATAHGAALASSAVIMVAARLPLSVPGALPRRAYHLARTLITQPYSENIVTRALEREAGYILLGALVSCWGQAAGEGASSGGGMGFTHDAGDDMLALLALAMGESVKHELDERRRMYANGDTELAMELWWRSVALQTLRTYLTCVIAKGLSRDPGMQVSQVCDLLAPVLEMMDSQPCLQDPARAKGGPAGLLAACSATFQLRLLECLHLLPCSRLQPASQSILIRMCSLPVRAAAAAVTAPLLPAASNVGPASPGGTSGLVSGIYTSTAAEMLHRAALRYCLAKEDAALGPWPIGRDAAEDELYDYAGERGSPHQQPWEPPIMASLFGNVDTTLAAGGVAPAGSSSKANTSSGSMDVLFSTDRARGALYPQPIGLAAGLLAAQASVLGRLLSSMSQGVQLQILDDLIAAASAGKGSIAKRAVTPAEREALQRRIHAANTLVAVVALSGLMPLARKGASSKSALDPTDKVADKVIALANAVLDAGGASSPGLARAGAQLMAASACIGSDAWAVKVAHAIADEVSRSVAENRDADRRAALCIALGSVHRAKGGLALQALVTASVEALIAVACRPHGHTALWALHALTLCAQSAGLAYISHVRHTLVLCQDLLVSGYEASGLRPACARLANAMVGVLGPEFTLGSVYYRMAKSLISDLGTAGVLVVDDPPALAALCAAPSQGGSPRNTDQPLPDGAPRPISAEALGCELQAVLFAQQLILFAPKAVQASKHVPMLQATLLSRRPALRKAAAATLHHLAERDPYMLLPSHIEGALFAALDGEPNAAIASQIRSTLETLLVAGAPDLPAYWLACLSEVVFSSAGPVAGGGGSSGANGSTGAGTKGDDGGVDDEDDDEGVARARTAPSISSPAHKRGASTGAATPRGAKAGDATRPGLQALLATVALRLRTRLFASELLLKMVDCVEDDPVHLDTSSMVPAGHKEDLQPGSNEGGDDVPEDIDRMVNHLQALVEAGFRLSTGQVEALRPAGVRLLSSILRVFSRVEDPLLPGARLLEQYQAQLVSSLRAALAPAAGPTLSIGGGALATEFLESGLAAGDSQVMKRLMDLLTGPLATWTALGSSGLYAEWVGVRQRVAVLQAHAQCATIERHGGDELTVSIVRKAHKPYRAQLASLWAALLQDHAILSSQHPLVTQQYRSALLASGQAAVEDAATSLSPVRPISASGSAASAMMDGLGQGYMTPGMVTAVRNVYSAACPVVLEALTAHFPTAAEVTAARTAAGAASTTDASSASAAPAPSTGLAVVIPGHTAQPAGSLWLQYCNLLDVGVMLVIDSGARLATAVRGTGTAGTSVGTAASSLCACIKGMQRLVSQDYLAAGLIPSAVLQGTLHATLAVMHGALAPMMFALTRSKPGLASHLGSCISAVAELLKEVAAGLPPHYLAGSEPTKGGSAASGNHAAAAVTAMASTGQHVAVGTVFVECLLYAASITTPFTTASTGEKEVGGNATAGKRVGLTTTGATQGLAPAPCTPATAICAAPLTLPDATQSVMDAALVHVLVAGQSLLRKAPTDALPLVVTPLLQLASRLLVTAPPGVQLQAAQRFFDAMLAGTAAASDRLAGAATSSTLGTTRGNTGGGGPLSPSQTGTPFSPASQLLNASVSMGTAGALAVMGIADRLMADTERAALGGSAGSSNARYGIYVSVLCSAGTQLASLVTCLEARAPSDSSGTSVALRDVIKTAVRVRRHVLATLAQLLQPRSSHNSFRSIQLRLVEAARTLLQEGTTENPPSQKAVWAQHMLAALGPVAAAVMHAQLSDQGAGPLDESETTLLAELMKLMLAGATLASLRAGEAGSTAVMDVLVPLVAQAAAPGEEGRSSPLLQELALRLVTTLPTSAALGASFKTAVAGLPVALKLRLQAALRSGPTPGGGTGAGAAGMTLSAPVAGASKVPGIKLKMTFAVPPSS